MIEEAETQRDIGRGRRLFLGPPSRRRHEVRRARPITLMKTDSLWQGRGGNVRYYVSREPPLEPRFRSSLKLNSLEEGRPLGHRPDIAQATLAPGSTSAQG